MAAEPADAATPSVVHLGDPDDASTAARRRVREVGPDAARRHREQQRGAHRARRRRRRARSTGRPARARWAHESLRRDRRNPLRRREQRRGVRDPSDPRTVEPHGAAPGRRADGRGRRRHGDLRPPVRRHSRVRAGRVPGRRVRRRARPVRAARSGQPAVTGTLTVRYRRPTPLHTELRFEGRFDRIVDRQVFCSARAFAGDDLVAEAEAVFVTVDRARFRPG